MRGILLAGAAVIALGAPSAFAFNSASIAQGGAINIEVNSPPFGGQTDAGSSKNQGNSYVLTQAGFLNISANKQNIPKNTDNAGNYDQTTQIGVLNIAVVNQNASASGKNNGSGEIYDIEDPSQKPVKSGADINASSVFQLGVGNFAYVDQDTSTKVDGKKYSGDNTSYVTQADIVAPNAAIVSQKGSNYQSTFQAGLGGNYASTNQNGSSQSVTVQLGAGNQSTTTQTGAANGVAVAQFGVGNVATNSQSSN